MRETAVALITGRRRRGQQASAQEFDAGASVHLSPQHFEAIDVAFDGAVAPRLAHGTLDRIEIAPECPHEALQCGCRTVFIS
jgi:hypothetical protein